MGEGKHTPGPWAIRDYKTKTGGTWIDGGFVRNRACGTVAEVYPLQHQDANVRLIAAAPEMLAALKLAALDVTAMAFNTRDRRSKSILNDRLKGYEAVIAKAEGRS